MAKNLNGVRIERCGLCPNFQTCTHHLFVREKISDACYLPDWTDAPADAHLEKKFPFGFELPAEAKPEPGAEGHCNQVIRLEAKIKRQREANHKQGVTIQEQAERIRELEELLKDARNEVTKWADGYRELEKDLAAARRGDDGPAIAELKIELGNVTAQLKEQHERAGEIQEQLNNVATRHSEAMTELFGRVAALESARDPQEVRGILKDEEWPEVEVGAAITFRENGEQDNVISGKVDNLTCSQAQAVKRCYDEMVALANDRRTPFSQASARRILKGGGK